MSSTDKYLEFLDRIFKRQLEETRSTGFSIWVLCSASIFLFWRILPIIFAQIETHNLDAFVELYVVLYNFCLPLFLVYSHYNSRFDRKQHFVPVPVTGVVPQTLLYIFLLIPPFIGTFFLNLANFDQRLINASFSLMFGMLLFTLYNGNIAYKRWKHTGYLPVSAISRKLENTKIGNVVEIIVIFLFLLPSVFSLFLFFYSDHIFLFNHHVLRDIIDLIVSTAIFNALLLLLITRFLERKSVKVVNQLERDIVLYEINEEEIKRRIEHEVLFEAPLGIWINERLGLIQDKGEAVIKLSQGSYDLKLNASDTKTYHANLLAAYISYAEAVQNMVKWFIEAQTDLRFHKDMFLSKIVDDTVNDLNAKSAEVRTLFNSAVDHLKTGEGLTFGGA